MSHIFRLKEVEIANGNLINADDLNSEFNQLVTESNDHDDRLNSLESGDQTIAGNKTFSGVTTFSNTGNTSFSGLINASGALNISRVDDPSTPADGTIWYNSNAFQYRFQVGGETLGFQPGAFPAYYRASAAPVYTSGSTFTIAYLMDRETANTANLYNFSPITVDISTNALNGCAQSAALAGTVSTMKASTISAVNSTSDTLTFGATHDVVTGQPVVFKGTVPAGISTATVYYANVPTSTTMTLHTSEANALAGTPKVDITTTTTGGQLDPTYIIGKNTQFNTAGSNQLLVGDVIAVSGGQNRRIVTVSSNTLVIVESDTTTATNAVTHKRGGEAPNTWYYLYAAGDFGGNTGFFLYTRNKAGGDAVPELLGYRYTQQAFAVRNDSAGNIIPFYVAEGWPYRPKIMYQVAYEPMGDTPGATNVKDGGSDASYTDLTLVPNFVPPISRQAVIFHKMTYTGGARSFIRQNGTAGTDEFGIIVQSASQLASQVWTVPTDASQIIEYKISGGTTDIDVMGFVVTEVH